MRGKALKNHYLVLLILSCVLTALIHVTITDWGTMYQLTLGQLLSKKLVLLPYPYIGIAGITGMVIAGWCSDTLFYNKPWNTNVAFHIGMIILLLIFILMPNIPLLFWHKYLLLGINFFTYGSRTLIILIAVELAHKKIRGTVIGFFLLLMYFGTTFSNLLIKKMLHHLGWNYFFVVLTGFAILITTLLRLYRPKKLTPDNKS